MRIRAALALAVVLALGACARPPAPPRLTLTRTDFPALPGWRNDDQGAALVAFRASCARLMSLPADRALGIGGRAADWQAPCRAAASVAPGQARGFFETWFRPYAGADNDKPDGLFTGYYEPELKGSLTLGGRYRWPLYRRPGDLVSVDLGLFRPDLKGETIAGKLAGGRLVPYDDRTRIEDGSLAGKGLELAWVDDPVSAFFLQIQGSGRIDLPDGRVLRVGYAGQNGRPYVAIGRTLVQRGDLAQDAVTMQTIRAWLEAHPGEAARSIMDSNPSYVFFRVLQGPGPLGAEGVPLTAGRSLAVDPRFVPYGMPIWLDAAAPSGPGRLERLMVAQDTGGAIRGPVRGDVFWGHGAEAEAASGVMKSPGRWYLLLPRTVTAPAG